MFPIKIGGEVKIDNLVNLKFNEKPNSYLDLVMKNYNRKNLSAYISSAAISFSPEFVKLIRRNNQDQILNITVTRSKLKEIRMAIVGLEVVAMRLKTTCIH